MKRSKYNEQYLDDQSSGVLSAEKTRRIKVKKYYTLMLIILTVFCAGIVLADAPFVNLQGVGGVGFNPLAYLAMSPAKEGASNELCKNVSKPRFGIWYANLCDIDVDWTTIGLADTIFNRLEVSYGFENISQENSVTHKKDNIGAKFLLLPENFNDSKYVPAISVGAIYKQTDNVLEGANDDGWEAYLVGTKLITQFPMPLLVSVGGLYTDSYVTGVFGYDDDYEAAAFANIDLFLTSFLVAGFEYKQGPEFDAFANADYWNLHLAWMANSNLTLVVGYIDAGDCESTEKVGLGTGFVLTAQYSF